MVSWAQWSWKSGNALFFASDQTIFQVFGPQLQQPLNLMQQPQKKTIQFQIQESEPRPPPDSSNVLIVSDTNNKSDDTVKTISLLQMFRFADKFDVFMMIAGSLGGLALGGCTPIFILFWGQFTNVFGGSVDMIVDQALKELIKFIYLGLATMFVGWVMIASWLITGERQAAACRKAYFATLLKQEIGWFDCVNQSELSSNFSSDTLVYQGAIGQKMAIMMQAFGTCLGGFAVAFSQGWLMSLVALAPFPLIAFSGYLYMRSLQTKSKQFQKIYATAGGLAQQTFYSIKTVKQLNGEQYEQKNYFDCLGQVKQQNEAFGLKIAASYALMQGSMFLLYSLGYWFGAGCVEGTNGCTASISGKFYSPGNVITVFFAILVACFYLSQLSPALKKIGEGKEAASRIYNIIEREPKIKNPQNGLKPTTFNGRIKFEAVTFCYPKDAKKTILNNITIEFDINNTALVGESGCGKSTILQLIMRFYDPDRGRILLDGNDLRDLDLIWLRNKIGYVGQEPVLFATSIRQNLLLGNQTATNQEIDQALKKAEAYGFVYQLEKKLETYVGSGGGQLSGGQKQRIAIARALLKKPKILLLDEATSALDRKNEKLIQNTLNEISQGLTTVTVAHRVNSIMNADIIYVIERGRIQQKGKFRELARYKDYKDAEIQAPEHEEKQVQKEVKKEEKQLKVQQVQLLAHKKSSTAPDKEKKKILLEQNKQLVSKYEKGIFKRVFGYLQNRNSKLSFVFGILLTMGLGLVYPIFSIFLGNIINALFYLADPSKRSQGKTDANRAGLAFLLLAIGVFIFQVLRDYLTYIVGDEITTNIRKETFQKMLKMPIYWFDKPDNNTGILSTRLGTDCQTINGMSTTYIYIMIQSLTTLVAGVVLALIYEWRTALVSIGAMPLVMLAGYIRSKFREGIIEKEDEAYKDSAQIIMESLTNVRTVVSFGVQNTVLHKYEHYLDKPQQELKKNALVSGFFFGLSQILNFIVFGLLFYIGTIFMQKYGVSLLDVFTAVYEIFFAGITIGNNSHFMPDIDQAKLAASHIFSILDSEDEEQLLKRENSKMIKEGIVGNIELKNVSFKYETRSQYVFQNMNLKIKPGQKVAFVGPSGCGKSTIIQLLQRFYIPSSGEITIDGVDIKDYDIHYLRSRYGVVSQEPVLFNASFRENIKYNKQDATEEQIRSAAIEANAMPFIEGKEKIETTNTKGQGFDRNVGIKGSHISGGQKQRVAIARAILRNPEILLLDEATSALDADNERKVQQSLDNIMSKKTTLTVAHRIETIKNADVIYVFEKGEIVQSGTYEKLIEKKGFFYNLERGTQFV